MSLRSLLTLLASASLFLIGCTRTPTVDTRAETEAIRSIEAQWDAAYKGRDIEKIVSLCSPDVVVMDANAPKAIGHQAIRKSVESFFADTLASKTYSQTVELVEVSASGDLAYDRGTSSYSRNTPKGPVEGKDKWVTIYKKIDGKWKAIVNIWNSDKPFTEQ